MPNQGRVCIAITKSNMGGAQKYVLTLAQEFKARGLDVTVVAGGDGELFTLLEQSGISYRKLASSQRDISISKEFSLFKELYRILRELNPDVLHLNSSKLGVLGTLVGRLAGIRTIIFTAHGWAFNENRPWWHKLSFYFLYWLTIMLSSKTICVSNVTREQILDLPFMAKKTAVVYNGIREPEFLDRDSARNELSKTFPDIDISKKWIAVLAELHPIKGHDTLFAALSQITERLSDYQVICIGDGELRSELRNLVVQKNIEKYVYFTGPIPRASRYLKAFDMSVLPSRSEAMPLAVLESGMAGTLVLASEVGGIPEVITPGVSGLLFRSHDVAELAEKLKTALALPPEEKEQMENTLKRKIHEDFSVDKMVEQTLSLYGRLS